jgi:hypothetical protein
MVVDAPRGPSVSRNEEPRDASVADPPRGAGGVRSAADIPPDQGTRYYYSGPARAWSHFHTARPRRAWPDLKLDMKTLLLLLTASSRRRCAGFIGGEADGMRAILEGVAGATETDLARGVIAKARTKSTLKD